jgi:hypothetical protein
MTNHLQGLKWNHDFVVFNEIACEQQQSCGFHLRSSVCEFATATHDLQPSAVSKMIFDPSLVGPEMRSRSGGLLENVPAQGLFFKQPNPGKRSTCLDSSKTDWRVKRPVLFAEHRTTGMARASRANAMEIPGVWDRNYTVRFRLAGKDGFCRCSIARWPDGRKPGKDRCKLPVLFVL